MKRPSFQFYPADWRNNAKLRRCSLESRGAWIEIMGVLHDMDFYGVCRWNLEELCHCASVPFRCGKELRDKNVLKGSDGHCSAFIYTPRHGGKNGEPIVLIEENDGPCWYSSRFVRDEYVRQHRGTASRFESPKATPKATPIPPIGYPEGYGSSSTSSSTSSSEERETVKFPEIPPMSRKDFDQLCEMRAIPKDCAEWFWNTHDARNWTDATGQIIRKIEPLLMNALKNWRAKKAQNALQNGNPETKKTRWDVTPDGQPIQVNL